MYFIYVLVVFSHCLGFKEGLVQVGVAVNAPALQSTGSEFVSKSPGNHIRCHP